MIKFKRIQGLPARIPVVSIITSRLTSGEPLILMANGRLYRSHDSSLHKFTEISGLSNVISVSHGEKDILVLTKNGTVYSWTTRYDHRRKIYRDSVGVIAQNSIAISNIGNTQYILTSGDQVYKYLGGSSAEIIQNMSDVQLRTFKRVVFRCENNKPKAYCDIIDAGDTDTRPWYRRVSFPASPPPVAYGPMTSSWQSQSDCTIL